CFLAIRHPPASPLFPYTTLFRSHAGEVVRRRGQERVLRGQRDAGDAASGQRLVDTRLNLGAIAVLEALQAVRDGVVGLRPGGARSEEHTSELQSRFDLVCRLLLE